jgi:hypothetical protein
MSSHTVLSQYHRPAFLATFFPTIILVFQSITPPNSVSLVSYFLLPSCIVVGVIVVSIFVIKVLRVRTPKRTSCTPTFYIIFRCVHINSEKCLFASSCLSICIHQCGSHWANFRSISYYTQHLVKSGQQYLAFHMRAAV